jgi:hypothetical protein
LNTRRLSRPKHPTSKFDGSASLTRFVSRIDRKQFSIGHGVLDAIAENSLAEHLRIEPLRVLTIRMNTDPRSEMTFGDQEYCADGDIVWSKGGLATAIASPVEVRHGFLPIRRRRNALKEKCFVPARAIACSRVNEHSSCVLADNYRSTGE